MSGFLKKIFNGSNNKGGNNKGGGNTPPTLSPVNLSLHQLAEILRYFPLGDRVQYYPEFQKTAALDTVILGYAVNNHFVYSPVNIRYQQDDNQDVLRLLVDGHEQYIHDVENFSFLIPFNQEDETKRGYHQRAELGPRGPFRKGNTITLVACSSGGTLSSVDTKARKILPLTSGIYAGHQVVLLDVEPSSLSLTDQRQHYRLPTQLPARLAIRDGGVYTCTLTDFSEESVQLRFERPNNDLRDLTEYRRLTLSLQLGDEGNSKEFLLDGVMYRKSDTSLVMKLQGIYKQDKLVSLGLVDILNIKASLLRHPVTQQALAEKQYGRS